MPDTEHIYRASGFQAGKIYELVYRAKDPSLVGLGPAVIRDVIPYALVGNDASLSGLNLVGLKRREFAREVIQDLRIAYRLLFADEGTLQERVDGVAQMFPDREQVQEIVAFIRAPAKRPLCLP